MDIRPNLARRRSSGLPSWMVSLVLHGLLLTVFWLLVIPESTRSLLVIRGDFADNTNDESVGLVLDDVSLQQTPVLDVESEEAERFSEAQTKLLSVDRIQTINLDVDFGNSESALLSVAQLIEFDQESVLSALNSMRPLSEALDGRALHRKLDLLSKYGGSEASEDAVKRALNWIAIHQEDDGGWSFAHDHVCNGQCSDPGRLGQSRNGATAMGLLPFLGAGHTHKSGKYKQTIEDGLRYLVNHRNRSNKASSIPQNLDGSWYESGGTMYSHCLATIAICEAYAMTNDSYLQAPAQSGIDFLVQSQNKADGGWRYAPGDRGDTSVVGWAVMALKSGKIGGLVVPETTLTRANRFLDRVSSNQRASYGYMEPGKNPHGLAATTSIGLLCRMYHGLPKTNRGLDRGVRIVAGIGPNVDQLYYSYYATQVMHHYGGNEWVQWNAEMRDPLIQKQIQEGHASGSWTPNRELDGMSGGRLYMTAMATMILEVYYRHMPLYTDQVLNDDFEL